MPYGMIISTWRMPVFFRDHEPVIYRAPSCNEGGFSYYITKKLSFTKAEDVEKRAVQAIKKEKNPDLSLARRLSYAGEADGTAGASGTNGKG